MPDVEILTISLPKKLAAKVHEQVATGEFIDVSDLVRQSLETFVPESGQPLGMSDADFDELLRREVLPVIAAMEADPSRGLSIEQVRQLLALEHAEFQKAG